MKKTTAFPSAENGSPPHFGATLPAQGDALITLATFAASMEISASTCWLWARTDPKFPPLIRNGARFTRIRLSDARQYIAAMTPGKPKGAPAAKRKAAAEAVAA